jgi:AcrR family transcriptional regulator
VAELSDAGVVRGRGGEVARDAREQILDTAYQLFCRRGIQAVGIDEIIAQSGVARQTLYRRFGSKQELVLAVLERRAELWTRAWLQAEVMGRASDPKERLLAVFDVFDEWFQRPDFEGCSFVNVMLEHPDPEDPLHQAAVAYLADIREFVALLAREAGIAQPEALAREWHILMKGSIVSAGEGDRGAARRARKLAELRLQAEQRPTPV